jgi:hypothetical protein
MHVHQVVLTAVYDGKKLTFLGVFLIIMEGPYKRGVFGVM